MGTVGRCAQVRQQVQSGDTIQVKIEQIGELTNYIEHSANVPAAIVKKHCKNPNEVHSEGAFSDTKREGLT